MWLFAPVWRHYGQALPDWRDAALIAGVLWQTARDLALGDWAQLATLNMFHPTPDTLWYSDSFLAWSVLLAPATLVLPTPEKLFAGMLAATLWLNVAAAWFFWSAIFSRWRQRALATVLTALSPFVLLMHGHVQMLQWWPSLWVAGMWIRQPWRRRTILAIAIGLAVQFTLSVYHCVFAATLLLLWEASHWPQKRPLRRWMVRCLPMVLALLLLAPWLYRYREVQRMTQARVGQEEVANYSAHLSDYVLVAPPRALFPSLPGVRQWFAQNRHVQGETAAFPGLFVLLGVGWWWYHRHKLHSSDRFFLALMGVGLLMSLGPRCHWNGQYCGVPLPAWLPLKMVPALAVLRAAARWSWLVQVGAIALAVRGWTAVPRPRWVWGLALTLLLSEVLVRQPFGEQRPWRTPARYALEAICAKQPGPLVEYPLRLDPKNLLSTLEQRTVAVLHASIHACPLVVGYSGAEPPGYDAWSQALTLAWQRQDSATVDDVLRTRAVSRLLVNTVMMSHDELSAWHTWAVQQDDWRLQTTDSQYELWAR